MLPAMRSVDLRLALGRCQLMWRCVNPGLKNETWGTLISIRQTWATRPADSMHVHPQQPVNASIFAAIDSRPLIPLWFPPGNFKFPYSSHSGVTCPYQPDAKQRALLIGAARFPDGSHRRKQAAPRGTAWLLRTAFGTLTPQRLPALP